MYEEAEDARLQSLKRLLNHVANWGIPTSRIRQSSHFSLRVLHFIETVQVVHVAPLNCLPHALLAQIPHSSNIPVEYRPHTYILGTLLHYRKQPNLSANNMKIHTFIMALVFMRTILATTQIEMVLSAPMDFSDGRTLTLQDDHGVTYNKDMEFIISGFDDKLHGKPIHSC